MCNRGSMWLGLITRLNWMQWQCWQSLSTHTRCSKRSQSLQKSNHNSIPAINQCRREFLIAWLKLAASKFVSVDVESSLTWCFWGIIDRGPEMAKNGSPGDTPPLPPPKAAPPLTAREASSVSSDLNIPELDGFWPLSHAISTSPPPPPSTRILPHHRHPLLRYLSSIRATGRRLRTIDLFERTHLTRHPTCRCLTILLPTATATQNLSSSRNRLCLLHQNVERLGLCHPHWQQAPWRWCAARDRRQGPKRPERSPTVRSDRCNWEEVFYRQCGK